LKSKKISGRLRQAFTANIHLKAASLIIAVILWAIVSGERHTEWAYLVPLEMQNVPDDLIITNNIPNFLDVRIQGPRSFIMGLNPKEMPMELDLSGLVVGSNIYPLMTDHIKAPRGTKVTRINPSYITLEVENLVRKKVKVKASIKGKPAKDFFVESVEVIPDTIEIRGAESETKGVGILNTQSVDITGRSENLQRDVQIDIPGKKIILSNEKPVKVKVVIKEAIVKMELKDVEVKVINNLLGASVEPSLINLAVEGAKSLVASIDELGVSAAVDAEGLNPGKYKKEVTVNLPYGIRLLRVKPKEVTLNISEPKKTVVEKPEKAVIKKKKKVRKK